MNSSSKKPMKALRSLIAGLREDLENEASSPVAFNSSGWRSTRDFLSDVSFVSNVLQKSSRPAWVLWCQNSYSFAVGFFALLHAGKHVLLPQNSCQATLSEFASSGAGFLSDCCSSACFPEQVALDETDRSKRERPSSTRISDITTEHLNSAHITLFTSGSSGKPKSCQKSLNEIEAEISSLEETFGSVLGNSRILSSVSHQHIYGLLFRVLWPLSSGRPFAEIATYHPQMLLECLKHGERYALVSSPAFLGPLSSFPLEPSTNASQITFLSSGGPLEHSVATRIEKNWGSAPLEVYGSTETGGIAWRTQSSTCAALYGSDVPWTIFPSVTIGRSAHGALRVSSPFIHSSLRSVRDSSFETHDLVEMIDNRTFHLLGRNDRIVKLGEKKVDLCELERVLDQHPFVSQCKIITLDKKKSSEGLQRRAVLGCAVHLSPKGCRALGDFGTFEMRGLMRSYLSKHFDRVCFPRYWRFLTIAPANSAGKISVAQVTQLFSEAPIKQGKRRIQDPIVIDTDCTQKDFRFEIAVPQRLGYLEGHFTGNPLVPGFVQLDWMMHLLRSSYKQLDAVGNYTLSQMKFLRPLRPGDVVTLRLSSKGQTADGGLHSPHRFNFRFECDSSVVSSGVISIE